MTTNTPPVCALCLNVTLTLAEAESGRFDDYDDRSIYMRFGSRRICAACADAIIQSEREGRPEPAEDKTGRKAIPSAVRWAVWLRDNFTCKRCGAREDLSIDHIHPHSRGGAHDASNFQTLCLTCNIKKGAHF